jgi:hypothetical protein
MIKPVDRQIPRNHKSAYVITCRANGKSYVGSSTDVAKRVDQHFHLLSRGKHTIKEFQRDFDMYAKDGYTVKVFEPRDTIEDILEMEECLIAEYDAISSGYNKNHAVRRMPHDRPFMIVFPCDERARFSIYMDKFESMIHLKHKAHALFMFMGAVMNRRNIATISDDERKYLLRMTGTSMRSFRLSARELMDKGYLSQLDANRFCVNRDVAFKG